MSTVENTAEKLNCQVKKNTEQINGWKYCIFDNYFESQAWDKIDHKNNQSIKNLRDIFAVRNFRR